MKSLDIMKDSMTKPEPVAEAPVNDRFADFALETSLHGIKYVFETGIAIFRKVFWSLALLGMLTGLLWSLINSIIDYYQFNSVTSTRMFDAWNLTLPAITICPYYTLNRVSMTKNYKEQGENISYFFTQVMQGKINMSQVPEKMIKFLQDEPVREFYIKTASENNFVYCMLKSSPVNCSEFIENIFTDKGVCKTFNGWSHVDQYGEVIIENSGPAQGVHLILDLEPEGENLLQSYGYGFQVLVHYQNVYPLMEHHSFVVAPGTETLVALQQVTNHYLRTPYSEKDCVDEQNMNQFKDSFIGGSYSHTGCTLLCRYSIIYNCKCDFWSESNETCTVYDFLTCALPNLQNTPELYFIKQCAFCLPTCVKRDYSVEVTSMAFPNTMAVQIATTMNWTAHTKETMKERYTSLKIFFKTLRYSETHQVATNNIGTMLSTFGGLMGLFMGASILTIFEFGDFFIRRVIKLIIGKKAPNQNEIVSI